MERKYYVIYDFANQPVYRPYYDCDEVDRCLADRDAEIVNLRARLDAEASHRLSLCADNERFIAEIEMLKRRIDAQHAANGELAVDLKEWRIRFPSNDPQIARRMVEDRAVAEANMDNAGLLAEIERLRAECGQYRWRMVEDELPPTETEVLLHLAPWVWGDPIMTGFMDEGSFVVHGYGSGNRVLAWMPLPPKLRGME